MNERFFRIKKITNLLLFLSTFAIFECSTYYFRGNEHQTLGRIQSPRRIAYLGFYTYKRNGRDTIIDYTSRTIPNFRLGKYTRDFDEEQFRNDVDEKKCENFVIDYLRIVGPSGFPEILTLFKLEKKEEKVFTYKLKDVPVDYIVVGIHLPRSTEYRNFAYKALSYLTHTISFFTLGFFPAVGVYEANTIIKIYDRNLNFIKEKKFDHSFSTISSIWISNNPADCNASGDCLFWDSPQGLVYEMNGPEIESYLQANLTDSNPGQTQ
ncbi:Lp29 family lipoprotein [Leptospira gomenensis]